MCGSGCFDSEEGGYVVCCFVVVKFSLLFQYGELRRMVFVPSLLLTLLGSIHSNGKENAEVICQRKSNFTMCSNGLRTDATFENEHYCFLTLKICITLDFHFFSFRTIIYLYNNFNRYFKFTVIIS